MNAHASINRIFRVIWNEAVGAWVAVPEIARGRRKHGGRGAAVLTPLAIALGLALPAYGAGAAPAAPPRRR
ncbi:MAG: ESPR-type extended signal peptide-containing protein, partial [Steroidobacteraceae bacterium]